MTDKELIELAAKAAGLLVLGYEESSGYLSVEGERFGFGHQRFCWNPLNCDSDALRLAVKLGLFESGQLWDKVMGYRFEYEGEDDPYAATRRAIVRAAAEIGRSHD